MISCRLKGGLGNIMFEIAFLEYTSMMTGYSACYYNIDNQLNAIKNYQVETAMRDNAQTTICVNDYLKIFKNFNWPKTDKPPTNPLYFPFHYVPFDIQDNTLYDGFFQSEKYFPNREFILNLFEPSQEIKKYLENKYGDVSKSTSLHVRRGDYTSQPTYHPPCTVKYYEKALTNFQGNVLVFSDDIEWCKKTFIGDRFIFVNGNLDYQELFLMSMCENNIIANSSFSWWGAWLNTNPYKKVIAPSEWFGHSIPENTKDLYPESWQII
jgi:hypothetical protein